MSHKKEQTVRNNMGLHTRQLFSSMYKEIKVSKSYR